MKNICAFCGKATTDDLCATHSCPAFGNNNNPLSASSRAIAKQMRVTVLEQRSRPSVRLAGSTRRVDNQGRIHIGKVHTDRVFDVRLRDDGTIVLTPQAEAA